VGGAEEVRQRVEEAIWGMLPELAPLAAGEFLAEFKRRTGWEYRFGAVKEVVKELEHGQWEVRVDRGEDVVVVPGGGCYAVETTVMWLIDTYNERFWVIDVDIGGARALPEGECRAALRAEEGEEGWEEEEEGWGELEGEDWEEEEEW
jgi:hypothetical protein